MGGVRPILLAALTALVFAAPAAAWAPVRNGGLGHDRMSGGPGADHLSGREGPDTLYGHGGGDLLSGDNGPDILYGGSGNDTLIGGAGRDKIYGGTGEDVESGGFGADHMSGGPGDDSIEGGQDDDTITGGAGDDVLSGGSGNDTISGGAGNDRIFADTGADIIDAGSGDDVIVVDGTAATRVDCGSGDDTIYITLAPNEEGDYGAGSKKGAGRRAADCEHVFSTDAVVDPNQGVRYLAPDTGGTRAGTSRDDVLLGGPGHDVLRGGRGDDVLWGLRQAGLTSTQPDTLSGGPGDDTIYGGPSFQHIDGGSGDDLIQAGVGSGSIDGGPGNDSIRMRGDGKGTYTIKAGRGNDTIYARGGESHARISCGPGHDVVHVDVHDRVSRDCERVVGTPEGRRAATKGIRAVRSSADGTYASMILATPGITHYWRLDAKPLADDYFNGRVQDAFGGTDGVTNGSQDAPGVTDDGDTAWDSRYNEGGISTYASGSILEGDFTYELWIRPFDSGKARSLLAYRLGDSLQDRVTLALEADGSLHGLINSSYDTDHHVDVQTPPLGLAIGSWHHIAWTRSATATAIYVDGAPVVSQPATPIAWDVGTDFGIGESFGTVGSWMGGLDEVAVYDRALDASTIHDHALFGADGDPPVTTMTPPIGPLAGSLITTRLSTSKGGSTFTCSLDGAAPTACGYDLTFQNLKSGPHNLTVRATDRFGVTEVNPKTVHFDVDSIPPRTLAAVVFGLGGDKTALATFGSDTATHFQCVVYPEGSYYAPGDPRASFAPCTPPVVVARGTSLTVAAVDDAGNTDPTPAHIGIPTPIMSGTLPGYSFGGELPTFAGVRDEVLIAGEPPIASQNQYQCRSETGPWAACPANFMLPIAHPGNHELQIRQPLPGEKTAVVLTAPLDWKVAGAGGAASIVALEFPAVLERGARLARRVPRVRLALNTAAKIVVDVVGHSGRQLASVKLDGVSGPNTIKVPASVLGRLRPDRYSMVVTATSPVGPPAVQRLSFAVVSQTI